MMSIDAFKRRNHISRIWRKVVDKSFSKQNTVFGEEVVLKTKHCPKCKKRVLFDNWYVKAGRQGIDPSKLTEKDLRDCCIYCYDSRENSRKARKIAEEENSAFFMNSVFGGLNE